MKTKIFSSVILSFLICLGLLSCKGESSFEEISVVSSKCPCDHETSFISTVSMKNILLFDSTKTQISQMKSLSLDGKESIFAYYSPQSKIVILYSFIEDDNGTSVSIGNICNFPLNKVSWNIPAQGILIDFTADIYNACNSLPSIGFKTTYTDNVLVKLRIKK